MSVQTQASLYSQQFYILSFFLSFFLSASYSHSANFLMAIFLPILFDFIRLIAVKPAYRLYSFQRNLGEWQNGANLNRFNVLLLFTWYWRNQIGVCPSCRLKGDRAGVWHFRCPGLRLWATSWRTEPDYQKWPTADAIYKKHTKLDAKNSSVRR